MMKAIGMIAFCVLAGTACPSAFAAEPVLAPMALNSMSNPPSAIATARVVDNQGTVIGQVQKVEIAGGKPSDVQIALLGGQKVVDLGAGQLRL